MMKSREKLNEYLHNYRFNSIFFKYIKKMLLLVVLPLVGMVVLSNYAYDNIQQQENKAYNEMMMGQYRTEWIRVLEESWTELSYISFNKNVELFMYDTSELEQLNYTLTSIQDLIKLPIISKTYVEDIYIYSEKNHKIISKQGTADDTYSRGKIYIEAFLGEAKNNKVLLIQDNYEGYSKQYLAVSCEISYGRMAHGLAVMVLNIEELTEKIIGNSENTLYLTKDNNILYAKEAGLLGKSVTLIPYYDKKIEGTTVLEQGVTINSCIIDAWDVELVLLCQNVGYTQYLSTVRSVMCLFVFGMFLLTIMMAFWISVRIYQPINDILLSISENRSILIGEEVFFEKDELNYILQTIRQSANKKQDLDEELKERVRLLKKAQAVALQSQINPHFLNNTLDTINWTAISLLGRKNEISEMTTALSRMLRAVLENTDTIIPMKVEIEHCMNYLKIQQKRYRGKFDVCWNIPAEVYQCKIIRVVLQPIVENAIYHGIKPLTNKGMIDIRARLVEDKLEICIADNGLGMSKEKLDELKQNMMSDMIRESSHIGVVNVNQRLKIYFGEEYGLDVESVEGVGTAVTIRLPQIM